MLATKKPDPYDSISKKDVLRLLFGTFSDIGEQLGGLI